MSVYSYRVSVIGQPKAGVTSLFSVYSHNTFPHEDYKPDYPLSFAANIMVDGIPYHISAEEKIDNDNSNCSSLDIPKPNVYMICFDLMNRELFESIPSEFESIIAGYQDIPFTLIGLKLDLRIDAEKNHIWSLSVTKSKILVYGYIKGDCKHSSQFAIPREITDICHKYYYIVGAVSTEEGKQMAQNINATFYNEASALTQEGLKYAWDDTFRAALNADIERRSPKATNSGDCSCHIL